MMPSLVANTTHSLTASVSSTASSARPKAERAAVVTRLDSGNDILIYVERPWVDYWSGFATLGKKIGHKVVEKQMEHLLEDRGMGGK